MKPKQDASTLTCLGEEDRRGGRVPLYSEPDIQLERRSRL